MSRLQFRDNQINKIIMPDLFKALCKGARLIGGRTQDLFALLELMVAYSIYHRFYAHGRMGVLKTFTENVEKIIKDYENRKIDPLQGTLIELPQTIEGNLNG